MTKSTTDEKDLKEKKEGKEKPDDFHILAKLKENYDLAIQYYARDHRRMRMLDQTDNGDLWKAIDAKFPAYQILPDTNLVAYVKDNILASLYTTAKSAEVRPTSEEDAELCTKLSLILEHIWDIESVGYKQFQAGERAALCNLGITQIGWDEKYYDGSNKGRIVLKNINPMNFLRDPFADNLEEASWCCTYSRLHKAIILDNPKYKTAFEKYLKSSGGPGSTMNFPNYGSFRENANRRDHYNVFQWWVRMPDGKINEIHTIDDQTILYKKEGITPAVFPFALLYCNLPSPGSVIGVSAPAKIFTNNVAYNMMNSLALTAEYKNQRPPKFVSVQSGLNIAAFTKYGAEADRTFIVNQDAERAVHYHQFPNISPNLPKTMETLQYDIQNVSGVDQKYTGRDTGSIITTGGTEEMLNRVTMIDTPKILNYEKYTKDLTQILLRYMIEFSPKRTYFLQNPQTREIETVEVDFPKIDSDIVFEYDIEISSQLPKNKQRVAAWADTIMEKQMQYRENGGNVELITEEEWLEMQDIPFKERMLERMGYQRDATALNETTQVLYQYASLLEQGIDPNTALQQTAGTLDQTRKGVPLAEASNNAMQAAPMPAMGADAGGVAAPPMSQEMAPPMM